MSDYISKDSLKNDIIANLPQGRIKAVYLELVDSQPTLDEKEIIRKPFERVVERLEERVQWYEVYGDCEGNSYRAYDHAIEIVKEECGISSEIKLLPCPFCGGEAVLYHQSSIYTDYDGNFVHCIECGCRTKLFECYGSTGKTHEDTKEEAIRDWNTRKPMEQILTRLEEEVTLERMDKMEDRVGKRQTTGFGLGVNASIEIVKEEGGIE